MRHISHWARASDDSDFHSSTARPSMSWRIQDYSFHESPLASGALIIALS